MTTLIMNTDDLQKLKDAAEVLEALAINNSGVKFTQVQQFVFEKNILTGASALRKRIETFITEIESAS